MFCHNPFNVLQAPSSGRSTPRSSTINTLATFDHESFIAQSQASTASTTKATIEASPPRAPAPPSTIETESLVSARTSATKDWTTQSDDDEDDNVRTPTGPPSFSIEQSLQNLAISTVVVANDEEDDDEEDGYGTWITPSNIKKHKIRDATTTNSVISATSGAEYHMKPVRRHSEVYERPTGGGGEWGGAVMKAACMTGDFAMQNVALQMGLNLVNIDGGGIRNVKTWVLRCHGCFTYLTLSLRSHKRI
jgi:rRNA maturation endonuclease Nob1